MGIFDFLKKKGTKHLAKDMMKKESSKSISTNVQYPLKIHSDLSDLIWVKGNEKTNYRIEPRDTSSFQVGGYTVTFSYYGTTEPSLLDLQLLIKQVPISYDVPRPPYFPSYSDLLPEQKWRYWEFLESPYEPRHDIGYVFIFYYGLERHLIEGNYEKAFQVILRLRDVYANNSFQSYSSSALVLSCLYHQRPDLAELFMKSIDKEHEKIIPASLLLLCKFSLDIPLTPDEIMRCANDFEFTNKNYIKKHPDLFRETLRNNIMDKFGESELDIKKFINNADISKIKTENKRIFANISIENNQIATPNLLNHFKFKKCVYDLLETTHNDVKQILTEMRKNGTVLEENDKVTKPLKNIKLMDQNEEKELLSQLEAAKNPVDRHFSYIALQSFYYKYRDTDSSAMEKCIEYCIKDIESLDDLQKYYKKEQIERLSLTSSFYTKDEVEKSKERINEEVFEGNIPAFKRLAIIFEKKGQILDAIRICEKAIKYGQCSDGTDKGFEGRIEKLKRKLV